MQEWFNWQSWKDCVPKGTASSNLAPTAKYMKKDEAIPVPPELYDPKDPHQQALIEHAQDLNARLSEFAKQPELMDAHEWKALNAQALQQQYPDIANYRMFHVVAGSTINESKPPKYFDLPGEASLLRALEALAGKEMYDASEKTGEFTDHEQSG